MNLSTPVPCFQEASLEEELEDEPEGEPEER